jgi:hypothetical protein
MHGMISIKKKKYILSNPFALILCKVKIRILPLGFGVLDKSPKFFIYQQMHFLLILDNSKIYIKTHIKIAPTYFGLRPSSGSLQLSLAKVTLMLKQSVMLLLSLCVMRWCGSRLCPIEHKCNFSQAQV